MQRILKLVMIILVCFMANDIHAERTKEQIIKLNDNISGKPDNATGYDFYVAFAPNEASSYNYDPNLEIYINSVQETEVDLYFGGDKIDAFKVLPFETKTLSLAPTVCEIRKSETPLKQTYRIVSKNAPISVYVINSKPSSSDGFMALPVTSYGKEYIHCSYWENGESKNNFYKSGFIVISPENNTAVTINLKSAQNVTYGKTDKGRTAGEVWNVTLNKGECYQVCTNAGTIGEFDISGTKITADKPIGLISYHERASIPRLMSGSRNPLVEMIPPTSSWGKNYFSKEFNRGAGAGDLFRIICKEPQTNWYAVWYDLTTGLQTGGDSGNLVESGDFVELVDSPSGRPNSTFKSVNGVCRIMADKPIQVFQYCFSSGWDGGSFYDPFYITKCSMENYINHINFEVAEIGGFQYNLNLFALGDTSNSENNLKLLNSVKIITKSLLKYDTIPILEKDVKFRSNLIPGTNIFWYSSELVPGFYSIIANISIWGDVYGKANVDGFGYPAGASFSVIGEKDVVAPKLTKSVQDCGNWEIQFTELFNDTSYSVKQVDLGVFEAPVLSPESYNAKLKFINSPGEIFPVGQVFNYYKFFITPIDLMKDMYAIVSIRDRASNISYDTVFYNAPKLSLSSKDYVDFGDKVKFRSNPIRSVFLENNSQDAIILSGIFLKNNPKNNINKPFEIIEGAYDKEIGKPFTLAPYEKRELKIRFNTQVDNKPEFDSLIVQTSCDVNINFEITGKAISPIMKTVDVDFGTLKYDEVKSVNKNLTIKNEGSATLTISDIKLASQNSAFVLDFNNSMYKLPFDLMSGKSVVLNHLLVFSPADTGRFSCDVICTHNGDEILSDSVATLTGYAYLPTYVDENSEITGISISPNPVTGNAMTVNFTRDNSYEIQSIEIIDESGKIIKNLEGPFIGANKIEIDTFGMVQGNYFLKVTTSIGEILEKIVVIK